MWHRSRVQLLAVVRLGTVLHGVRNGRADAVPSRRVPQWLPAAEPASVGADSQLHADGTSMMQGGAWAPAVVRVFPGVCGSNAVSESLNCCCALGSVTHQECGSSDSDNESEHEHHDGPGHH
jgi:hypothetical protein